ncbi:SIMPL domain-containing protein [Massilia sp. BJB1822]|uniref:SIMPL domain-containing protein n=1 Tax=Massilia sp. BJB1822 TaxID=2744470 RepID=UPI0015943BD5|nr:SIMPL domain-containing protein [Massilia sp. BJB1822]NVD99560.1 SIMPL domain-containing protein [Massilia sp. BJB1822]
MPMLKRVRCALALMGLLGSLAVDASPLPAHPFVSTSGKAQQWLAPDLGEMQFETGAQHGDSATAAAALDAKGGALLALLARHGVAPADIECFELEKKTVALSQPAADGSNQAYVLTRHYRVTVRDLRQWPELAQALVAQEVDSFGVSFDRSDRDQVNAQLMAEAARAARGHGQQLAAAFGRKLGPAVAIARGPLDRIAAPFLSGGSDGGAQPASRLPAASNYAVPSSIPFAQAVNAIFRLQ